MGFGQTSHWLATSCLCAILTPAPLLGRTDCTLKVLWLDWCSDPSTVVLPGHRRWPAQVMHPPVARSLSWVHLCRFFEFPLDQVSAWIWNDLYSHYLSVLPAPPGVYILKTKRMQTWPGWLISHPLEHIACLVFEIPKWLWGIKIVIWPYSFLSCIKLKSINYTIAFNLKYMPRTKDSFLYI